MRSYNFSEPSAFNSSFVSTMISSSFYHRLSFPLVIKLITPVGNWGKVWTHSVSLLFPCVLYCWRALVLLFKLCEINLSFPLAVLSIPLLLSFCTLLLFPIFVQIYSLSYVSLSSLVWSRNLSSCILSCLGYRFLIQFLTFVLNVFSSPACSGLRLKPQLTGLLEDMRCSCSRWWCVFSSAEYPNLSPEVSSCSWRIVGYGWRRRQLLQVSAGGNSPYRDPVMLLGAHTLSQSVLCFEMKVEALAKDFVSHWCSVFGQDRKENWAQGSPCYGMDMRHKILMKQVFNLHCLWGLLQMIISSFPTGKSRRSC